MKLNFKESGNGQPLIILHGLFGSLDNWVSIAKQLEAEYRVFLVDQRNHGKSPHSSEWDYQVMADDLKEFIEEHQLTMPIIVGHSMGGKVAMKFAGQHPNDLGNLVVVDMGPKAYPVHHRGIIDGLKSLDLSSIKSRGEVDKELSHHISEFGVRQFLLKNLTRDEMGGFSWKMNLDVIDANIENVGEDLLSSTHYDGRCLFLRGSNSNYIVDEDISDLKKSFPNSVVETIEGAGHWIHAEKPQEFLTALKSYLD